LTATLALTALIGLGGGGVFAAEGGSPGRFDLDDGQARPISTAESAPRQATWQDGSSGESAATTPREPARPFTARWSEVNQRQVIRPSEDWRLRWREADVASRRRDESAATGEQAGNRRAATWSEGEVAERSQSSAVGTGSSPAVSNGGSLRFAEPRRLATSQPRGRENPIRLVSQEVPVDPFNDPFGDRALPMPAERASDAPALTEPPLSPPAPARGEFAPQAAPTQPAQPQFRPFDPAPEPLPGGRSPLGYDPAPVPPSSPSPSASSNAKPGCERIYNRRNCCVDGSECDEHRQRVRQAAITEISLNITPQMTVTQLDRMNYESERQNTMRRVPPRVWRNDDGDILADGRMTNFRNGRVEVETEDGLKKLVFSDLSDDDMCFLAAWWSIPSECSLGNDPVIDRDWVASTMTFKASGLCHKPLYFEDVNLERYGHTAGPILQPALSGAHFFMNVVALPYNMGINPPTECRYPLGYYRPGDCAPWLVRPIPLSIRGGLTAAATYVGGALVLP